jgi:hypothetical protein
MMAAAIPSGLDVATTGKKYAINPVHDSQQILFTKSQGNENRYAACRHDRLCVSWHEPVDIDWGLLGYRLVIGCATNDWAPDCHTEKSL